MERRIITDKNFLSQPCRDTSYEEIHELGAAEIMRDLMNKAWTPAVGLAANQAGFDIRFAIYKIDEKKEIWLVNPEIISASNLIYFKEEGCLSIPNRWFTTWRYSKIVYLNEEPNGERKAIEVSGFEAFVVQHEIDHLNGVLCSDHQQKPGQAGRNEPCPCGSGKKFKKCCINQKA